MNKKIVLAMLTLFFLVIETRGQTTSDELARKVFNCFRVNDLSKLDTLIPTHLSVV